MKGITFLFSTAVLSRSFYYSNAPLHKEPQLKNTQQQQKTISLIIIIIIFIENIFFFVSFQFYDYIEKNKIAMSNLELRALTMFAPTNEAFQKYKGNTTHVQYHMSKC